MNNYFLLFFCLAINILVTLVYFSKKRIDLFENKIYISLIFCNLLCIIFEILCNLSATSFLYSVKGVIVRAFLIGLSFFGCLLTLYTIIVSTEDETKYSKIKSIILLFNTIMCIPIFFLKINFEDFNGIYYATGSAVNYIVILGSLYYLVNIYLIIQKNKVLKKKMLPIIAYMGLMGVSIIINKVDPTISAINCIESFVVLLMYFTIENPDVRMLTEMTMLKEQADRANNAKSDFLSNMSHEIRTPLNAIVGFSETLKDEDIPQSARENVDDIIMASNNLLDIVNGILDISKIEANKLEIINKEYDIKSILDELIALTKARIGDKGLDFRVNIDPSLPRVLYGDNIRLKQVVLNILTNAVKYTKEGYVIFTVSSVIKDNVCRLIFSVEDSGIGIKEESIPKLFSKFERLDVEKEITIEGTGLGLAITKRLVELMNGTIVVQSVYGKGSKFTISIDQRIIAVEAPVIHEAPAAETKIVDAKGAKILVVDDNDLNLKVATVLLNKYHFTIDTATNGIECVNKVKRGGEYDIIFLDDMMPKMNGREALAKLKEDPNFNIPVIALTANAITGMRQEYLNCGFNDYLSKPIEKQELERVIKEYISKKRSSYANTDLSKSTNSILEKQFTIDLPVLAQNTSETPTNSDNSNKKVLVVDDNEMNLKIAVSNLKKYGFTIDSVSSGSDAIAKAIENHYDLVFLDEMMPELDGCKTLENLRDIDGFDAPTIMMTASPEDEVKDKIEEYKFNGYLSKPFKKEELDKVINDLLK